jgi:hypothetical protein
MTRGHPRPEAILRLIVDFQFCREPGISELDRDERDADHGSEASLTSVFARSPLSDLPNRHGRSAAGH